MYSFIQIRRHQRECYQRKIIMSESIPSSRPIGGPHRAIPKAGRNRPNLHIKSGHKDLSKKCATIKKGLFCNCNESTQSNSIGSKTRIHNVTTRAFAQVVISYILSALEKHLYP